MTDARTLIENELAALSAQEAELEVKQAGLREARGALVRILRQLSGMEPDPEPASSRVLPFRALRAEMSDGSVVLPDAPGGDRIDPEELLDPDALLDRLEAEGR